MTRGLYVYTSCRVGGEIQTGTNRKYVCFVYLFLCLKINYGSLHFVFNSKVTDRLFWVSWKMLTSHENLKERYPCMEKSQKRKSYWMKWKLSWKNQPEKERKIQTLSIKRNITSSEQLSLQSTLLKLMMFGHG